MNVILSDQFIPAIQDEKLHLKKYLHQQVHVSGYIANFQRSYKRGRTSFYLLLQNAKIGNEILSHIWVPYTNKYKGVSVCMGDKLEFDAVIRKYEDKKYGVDNPSNITISGTEKRNKNINIGNLLNSITGI